MCPRKGEKCCVPGCVDQNPENLLFLYPTNDESLTKKWKEILKLKKTSEPLQVCNQHFDLNDFIEINGIVELQNGAIPKNFEFLLDRCRFCFKELNERQKVKFSEAVKMFEELTGLKFKYSQHLSNLCCSNCFKEIERSIKTRKKVIESQKTLNQFLQIKNLCDSQVLDVSIKEEIPDGDVIDEEILMENLNFDQNLFEFNLNEVDFIKKEEGPEAIQPDNSIPETEQVFVNQTKKRARGKTKPSAPSTDSKKKDKSIDLVPVTKTIKKKKQSSWKTTTVSCEYCDKVIRLSSQKKHYSEIHNLFYRYECDLCGARKYQKDRIVLHMISKHISREYREKFHCTVENCDKVYLNEAALRSHHKFTHLKHFDKICEICGIFLKTAKNYDDHMRMKHTFELAISCKHKGCDFKAKTSLSLYDHNQRCHRNKPFTCKTCNETFNTFNEICKHRVKHREKKMVCDFENCTKAFRTKFELKKHKDSLHFGLKKIQCDVCSAQFKNQNHILRHITSVHLKPEFKCEVQGCPAKYARKDFLRSHVKSHHNNLDPREFTELLDRVRKMKGVVIDKTKYTYSKI